MNAADIFVKTLEAEGIEYVFGVPGEENLAFLESLRTSKIKFIATRHEQAAGFMAATIGRLTGNPGVCLSTLGPGATNLVTSVAYAQLGAMPALFITGQKPIRESKQGHFQIIDTVGMMRPLTKSTQSIVDVKLIKSSVQSAIKLARDERPGAVHLELPEDVASDTMEISEAITTMAIPRRPVAEDKAIAQAVELFKQANHPLVLVGAGANRKRVSNMLTRFIETTHIPFVTTQLGKGVVSEDRPEYLGTTALSSGDYVHEEIKKADLILNIGHDTVEKPPFLNTTSAGKTIIHLNFFPATPNPVYNPSHEIIGDIANALWQLIGALDPVPAWDLSVFTPVKARAAKQLADTPDITPFHVITNLRSVLAREDIVTLDNGMYKLYFARHYETYAPGTLLLDNALATMGAGLPSAIAAKLINPTKKVVAVTGDGGFMMNSQELETAKRLGLDLVVLILRDNEYGMISWKQKSMGLTDFGLGFDNPNFKAYAQSYGVSGHEIKEVKELGPLVTDCFAAGSIHVIDIPMSYADNQYLGA